MYIVERQRQSIQRNSIAIRFTCWRFIDSDLPSPADFHNTLIRWPCLIAESRTLHYHLHDVPFCILRAKFWHYLEIWYCPSEYSFVVHFWYVMFISHFRSFRLKFRIRQHRSQIFCTKFRRQNFWYELEFSTLSVPNFCPRYVGFDDVSHAIGCIRARNIACYYLILLKWD